MKKEFLNKKFETMSSAELRPIQEEKFSKQIDYVWENSPFYQSKFREHGIERGDIKSLEDLPRLPFTEKDELEKKPGRTSPTGLSLRRADEKNHSGSFFIRNDRRPHLRRDHPTRPQGLD